MTAMPRGKLRPPIVAPRVDPAEVASRSSSVRLVRLTTYRFLDDSEYTMREFDYRLRWTLFANHMSMTGPDSRGTRGHATASLEVWSRRDAEWHQVWEISCAAESPYGTEGMAKKRSWDKLLADLAAKATEVLL